MSAYPPKVRIVEVGPRDGLQNEKAAVPMEAKRAFIVALAEAGLKDIEIGAFVRPDRVPQMAGSDKLALNLPRKKDVTYWALVPNRQGAERALAAGIEALAVFTAASETFSQKNANATVAQSLEAIREVMALVGEARKEKGGEPGRPLRVRAYISACFGCPYEGRIPPKKVAEVAKALLDLGISEISVGDTIGVATPRDVEEVFGVLLKSAPAKTWAGHFHDTRGQALANVLAALQMGISNFDASAGGLGGCPFAPGASGNLATEDLAYMLQGMGIDTGVDLAKLAHAAPPLAPLLDHPLPGKYLQSCRV